MLSSLWSTTANFSLKHNMPKVLFVDVLLMCCCTTDVSLALPMICPHDMLQVLMLESIFERNVRPWFVDTFWCHCHLQCQVCDGLGDGQDTERFSNNGVSLGCSHYSYTKVCSQITSGGDLCHVGTSKLISETNL